MFVSQEITFECQWSELLPGYLLAPVHPVGEQIRTLLIPCLGKNTHVTVKVLGCAHNRVKIHEPHLAGARKCLDCEMVYNPNHTPNWFFEEKKIEVTRAQIEKIWNDLSVLEVEDFCKKLGL
jgi:hypothetical protein